jgi:hypothetical protein
LVYFKFDPSIGEVALQVYIDPFMLNVGGLSILEVRGVTADSKAEKKVQKAKRDLEKSRREEKSRKVMVVELKKHHLDGSVDCTKVLCSSCARAFEGQAISVNCSMSPGYVIADILDASWGEDANQPAWDFSSVPGRCGISEIETGEFMVKANRSATLRTLVKKCRGRQTCDFAATTSSMVWRCRLTI